MWFFLAGLDAVYLEFKTQVLRHLAEWDRKRGPRLISYMSEMLIALEHLYLAVRTVKQLTTHTSTTTATAVIAMDFNEVRLACCDLVVSVECFSGFFLVSTFLKQVPLWTARHSISLVTVAASCLERQNEVERG